MSKKRFPRCSRLSPDEEGLVISIQRLLRDSRDWTKPRPRELNADRFKEEIRRNRSVKGWIQTGNIWMDGKLTVRDPYGTTDIRLHACEKLYQPGGEYCEVLGHFACSECLQMTNKRCAEDDLPTVNFDLLAADRPLSAPWRVISTHKRALRLMSASTQGLPSRRPSSTKIDQMIGEAKISDILEEERKSAVFLTEMPSEEEPKKRESLKPQRKVFKNDLEYMCPPLVSMSQTRITEWG